VHIDQLVLFISIFLDNYDFFPFNLFPYLILSLLPGSKKWFKIIHA